MMRRVTSRRDAAARRTMEPSWGNSPLSESFQIVDEDEDSDIYPEEDNQKKRDRSASKSRWGE